MITDPIADALTRIRNAQRAGHKSVSVRCSKMNLRLLQVLQSEGFISYFEKKDGEVAGQFNIEVGLKYFPTGEPLISKIKRVSRPGRRVYAGVGDLPKVDAGLGLTIVSTSEGVVSDRVARQRKIGGEVLALVG
jgi:small subunit ribosomal protein S8